MIALLDDHTNLVQLTHNSRVHVGGGSRVFHLGLIPRWAQNTEVHKKTH